MYRFISFLLLILFAGCDSESQREKLANALKDLQDFIILETSTSGIIRPLNQSKLWCIESTILVRINLQKLDTTDITIHKKKVNIIVPKPYISSFDLNPNSLALTYNENDKASFLLTEKMKKELLIKADTQFKNNIDTLKILSKAEENLTRFLSGHLKALGFTQISIRYNDR